MIPWLSKVWVSTKNNLRVPWIAFCIVVLSAATCIGVIVGWTLRTRLLRGAPTSIFSGRVVGLEMDLIAVDPLASVITLDWTINDDTCIYNSQGQLRSRDHIIACPIVNVYFDPNLFNPSQGGQLGTSLASNNVASTPIFQYNASAYALDISASLAVFRTEMYLYSDPTHIQSSLKNYPFDQYYANVYMFGRTNDTNAPVGLSVSYRAGVAFGFTASVEAPDLTDDILNVEGRTNIFIDIPDTTGEVVCHHDHSGDVADQFGSYGHHD
ncbi:hypothetical protein BV25DRAFT_1161814 [Artomyces pyxidatus]|uniref:Uncharacterized protein n=1 Tax=Artomyces pyxidatus TaxID=48021 RepID=A0ACB8SU62_9AGAM|nr:hypothetical protein BV25DRAFT_1161814 [Artomyces pyxidatus]